MRKIFALIFCLIVYGLSSMVLAQAYAKDKELTLIYTGETHAALYPCTCPIEPDGGVARRATLIKQLRKQHTDVLLLDSGNFFSAGALDQNSQNPPLDKQRAIVNLRAMELMRYDAIAISDDEFNFDKDFLKENIEKVKLNFVSSNLKFDKVAPYIIKEAAGLKIGIIGLTNLGAGKKGSDLEFIKPKAALENSVQELKKKGVSLIILLSNLGESYDLRALEGVAGVDVLIDSHASETKEPFTKVGGILVLRPSWQGRRLSEAVLSIKAGKIGSFSVKELRVSDKISDDPDILSILPRCFSDSDCNKKEGLIGSCRNAGAVSSSCMFTEAAKVNLTVITSKDCAVCNTEPIVNSFKKRYPGLTVTYLYYPDKKAVKLIEEFKVSGLPAYLLGKEIIKEKNFDNLKSNLVERENYFMLKPEVGGISHFLNRDKIKGRLDLFISLFDNNSLGVLDATKEFNPIVHFLSLMNNNKIETPRGDLEAEEDLRGVCVQKYYPASFWSYITCRAKNINSSWWEDCAIGLDANKIKACARGSEGEGLLKENSRLNSEVKIMFGPTYLLDNNEIFTTKGAPSKEELKKLIRK